MIKETAKVKNYPDLVRDTKTKAIVNIDTASFETYHNERQFRKEIKLKASDVEQDINILKSELSDIKKLLITLIDKTK